MAEPVYYQDIGQCVDAVIEKIGNPIVLGIPLGLGKPNRLTNEIYQRAKNDPCIKLTILTALTLELPRWSPGLEQRFMEPFVKRVFGDYVNLDYAADLRRGKLPPNIEVVEFYYRAGGFLNIPLAQQNYISCNYTHAARDIIAKGCNVVGQMIAKADIGGKPFFSLSCNPEVSYDVAMALRKQEKAGKKIAIIGEVNQNLPFMYGDAVVEPDIFDAVVDNPAYYHTLFGVPKLSMTVKDYCIGLNVSALIKDGGTLQIGIGSLGDAIVYGMMLRHQNNDTYRQILTDVGISKNFGKEIQSIGGVESFSEGIYGSTEMMVDGYLHLLRAGIIKRKTYNHLAIQRLIHDGKINETVTPDTLRYLIDEGAVSSKLSESDAEMLKYFGIINDKWRYEDGFLVCGDTRIMADLSDESHFKDICRYCLGTHLKNGILIYAGFFLGPQSFYTALRTMNEEERKQIFMTSVLKTNQLYGDEPLRVLQRQYGRFANTALMATLNGAAVSDGLENGQVVSGVGGQYNFVAMAHEIPGARSIIMLKSTRTQGRNVSSTIRWNYGHITIPRHLRDIVVTEYGIADIRGKTDKEVIKAMLAITDSRFQEELLQTAKRQQKIPKDWQIPDAFRNNTPEKLENALGRYRKQGLFPAFPFGSDFTQEEIVLGKTLKELKNAVITKRLKIPTASELKQILSIPASAKPYLERMGLEHPKTLRDRMLQKLLLYGLVSGGHI